jgi:N-acetylmuramoyl-L-alanine amidase
MRPRDWHLDRFERRVLHARVVPPGGARRNFSAILCVVRKSLSLVLFLLIAAVSAFLLPSSARGQVSPEQEAQPTAPQQQAPPQAAQPAPAAGGPVIVLDPAHGGTDTGARGDAVAEKDIVLQLARTVRAELERRGYRVVMTRNDDSNPSYDDRAAMANAYRDSIFISLHVSSTGTPGTARAYYDQFATPIPSAVANAAGAAAKAPNPSSSGLVSWEEAQRPHLESSHRLANFIQSELGQLFSGSPALATGVAVRALRSVEAPAVAIEISSVSSSTPDLFNAAAPPLADAIARGIVASRQPSAAGAK